ncbi:SMI1/KNR4 family protein [Streptosporangium sp. NPDC000396]|uniref:SMI1/KNR4 family protein n=1 Tax=Streptosporangium sp. NPDC000396 TaxID=3366185 RepID=UPI00368A0C18
MLRLITSRWVRLALVAAVVTAIVVAVLRLRRSPAVPETAPHAGAKREATKATGTTPEWPPAPILGTPTAEDLKRYAARPYIPRFLNPDGPPREPAKPLDAATRRSLVRWGAIAAALVLLVFASQALETATFSKETETETQAQYSEHHYFDEDSRGVLDGRDCTPASPAPGGMLHAFCAEEKNAGAIAGEQSAATPSSDPSPVPSPEETAEASEAWGRQEPDRDCAPAAGAPVVRRVNPRVVRAVNRQWARIERWLRTNAPASYRTLAKPARARTIAIAEAQMGLMFPDALRASLLRHNGAVSAGRTWPFGFLGQENMGVREIRDTWRTMCGIDAEDVSDPRSEWWDGRMIPFASDGSGNNLVIDSVRRDVGETDHEGQMNFEFGEAPIRSYYALLKGTADALETGGLVGHWKPQVVEGELDWDVPD